MAPTSGLKDTTDDEAHTAFQPDTPAAADEPTSEAPTIAPTSGLKDTTDDEAHTSIQPDTPATPSERPPGAARKTPISELEDAEEGETMAGVRPASGRAAKTTGPLEVGQAFSDRYQIIELLGAGGMGAVYKAWDAILSIVVAIKVIRPEALSHPAVARDLESRFKRELLLARMVTHKNVVRIHDIGEIDGIKYITMSYVEGVDLAEILKREGKLPVPRALRIGRRIVSGLKAAHEVEVVHRDLKPPNIMVDADDEPLIMDFGVARSKSSKVREPKPAAQPQPQMKFQPGVTMPGVVVGTYDYMAPEQAKGKEVDQRADLYAFGLILYDMLVGPERRPSRTRETAQQAEETNQAPLSARAMDPEIPEALDEIILRCQERDPEARYQSAEELEAELNKLDENGEPLPVAWRFSRLQIAAAAVLAAVAVVGTWWFTRTPPPPVQPDPVTVLIADFQNGTNDSTFDRTLEPMLKLALEDADFITAYSRNEIRRGLGVRPPDVLDDVAARELAVNQGLGVVLSGSVNRQDSGYRLAVTATQAVTGDVITNVEDTASDKTQVLVVATELATDIRDALGDQTSDSARRFAMETLSATSLEVVGEYAGAMEALSRAKYDEALEGFSNAVALDPNFGLAYAGMAIASRNLDRQEDAEKYAQEALRHLDGMTERERYRARGLFYMVTGDHPACVKEYSDLIARFSADAAARNNLALCSTYLRDIPRALDEMQQVVEILPNRALYRENLALYASYASDFETAEQEARAMEEPGLFGLLALAFAQVGQGQLQRATETYRELGKIDAQGASYAASGLGDLALYEGRLSDAARIFQQGAASDVESEDTYRAAAKFAALAHTQLLRQRNDAAIAAAEKALANSEAVKIRFLAARVFVEAGDVEKAQALAEGLANELQAEPQAYAKIIEGETALKQGDPRAAIKALTEANELLDTWMGHFDLGRAYLEAGAFPQADSELDRCVKRRGEALSLFLDEEPTYGYFPPVYYYQGRVREELNSASFTDSYRTYLDIRGEAGEDPFLKDVRNRVER
jgi:serine/threonine protein kinase/tetratricopeptide (TPR) repeat protein